MDHFKPPEPFSFEGTNVSDRWRRWEKQFRNYFLASESGKKAKKVQVAILLHCAGPDAQEIHEQFVFTAEESADDYEIVLGKFKDYCHPRKNTVYERYRLWTRDQNQGESVDQWVKELRLKARSCEFKDQEHEMICDKIVFGVLDSRVKERLLREADLNLEKALNICRAAESTKSQLQEMTKQYSDDKSVNEITTRTTDRRRQVPDGDQFRGAVNRQGKFEKRNKYNCYNCGGEGHFSRDCPSGDSFPRGRKQKRGRGAARGGGAVRGRGRGQRYLHEVEEEEDDVEDDIDFSSLSLNSITVDDGCFPCIDNSVSVDTLSQLKKTSKRFVTLRLHKTKHNTVKEMKCKLDTGAEANVMPLREYKKLCPEAMGANGLPKDNFVEKNDAVLKAYGNTVIKQLGRVHLPCEFKGLKFTCGFFLADVEGPILLGLPTCEALGIVKFINLNATSRTKENVTSSCTGDLYVHPSTPIGRRPPIKSKSDLKKMYPECFTNVTVFLIMNIT